MSDWPRYWYGEKNWLGQRSAVNWQGWVADITWWFVLPFTARFLMNPAQYPMLCIALFFGWIFVGMLFREWMGER